MDIRNQIYRFIDMYVDTPEPKKLCSSIQDLVEELAEYKVKNINVIPCCKSDSEQLPDVYLQELSKVEWTQQTQVSLNEQLQILRQFANKLGLYDASDYLKK